MMIEQREGSFQYDCAVAVVSGQVYFGRVMVACLLLQECGNLAKSEVLQGTNDDSFSEKVILCLTTENVTARIDRHQGVKCDLID